MKDASKQSGLIETCFVLLGCHGLKYWPLGMVGKTWVALLLFVCRHGLHAAVPNLYASFLFAILVAFTVELLFVNWLAADAKERIKEILSNGNGDGMRSAH
ncbi:MAG TPA: hypothetical protein VFE38_02090 [Edaphobacter sp.]|nr:hypothetical protein [Edaphobacter sp.]